MTIHEIAQLELAAWLFGAAAAPLTLAARYCITRCKWPSTPTWCAAALLSCIVAAFALADGENGKPVPPQVRHYMRVRASWLKWTQAVKMEWEQAVASIFTRREFAQRIDGEVIAVTNTIRRPATRPAIMQLRPNLLENHLNQNIKLRVRNLNNNGDGTWTVEVQASRAITDEPALMMYLRRRSDGAVWWVEHESTSFPTNTAENAFSYTFRPPVGIEGYVVSADEVLLGGANGCQIEGVVLVDPADGLMYEGVTGDYIVDGIPVQVRGGVIRMEQSTAAEEPEERLFGKVVASDDEVGVGGRLGAEVKPRSEELHRVKLAMPPLDSISAPGKQEGRR